MIFESEIFIYFHRKYRDTALYSLLCIVIHIVNICTFNKAKLLNIKIYIYSLFISKWN